MASRNRSRLFGVALGAMLLAGSVGAAPVAAASPTPRLATSAEEWATFTPAEKQAAIDWIKAQPAKMKAAGTWSWDEETSAGGATTGLVAVAITGDVECGIKLNKQPGATYAIGWSSVWASASAWALWTGGASPYVNTLYHNGTRFSWGWEAAGSGTYEYNESARTSRFRGTP